MKHRPAGIEMRTDEQRADVKHALVELSKAMRLSRQPGGIVLPDDPTLCEWEVRMRVFHFIGELLLGDDAPDVEVLC